MLGIDLDLPHLLDRCAYRIDLAWGYFIYQVFLETTYIREVGKER